MNDVNVKEVKEVKDVTDLLTKFTNTFSEEVHAQTYSYGKEDINQTLYRTAENIASIEVDRDKWTNEFQYILNNFKFVPGGRILSNAGTGLKGTTYINCFVDGFIGRGQDSMEGILDALRRQALILKSEGGYGFCADTLRPRGGFIGGIGNESPGSVRMLNMWDTQSAVITEGSGKKSTKEKSKIKIRKGAQMVTMSCWHPDIEEFITAKQTAGNLTKFNMSVLVTDSLIEAVRTNQPWTLEFPDFEDNIERYDNEWDGNLGLWKSKGYPIRQYKTYENANELWDVIMTSTYTRNEPGVLYVDKMNHFNNLWYNEYISATNPCGEQILPIGGVCLLGSLNLTQFVKGDNWNYAELERVIPSAIRFMDNVNDITYVPLEGQKDNLKNKRRIGLGVMGYGSALLMMKVRYGSEKALKLTEDVMSFIANKAYQASSKLAKEKGAFPLFDREKYLSSNFVKNLSQETKDMISEYGIRNSHLLSIQPTGNTGVLANNVSGGLEPLFMFDYIRTTIFPYTPEGLNIPYRVDFSAKTFKVDGDTKWNWVKEGDENLLRTEFMGYFWKFDQSRGLLRETIIRDYGVDFLNKRGDWDSTQEWASNIFNLSIKEHVDTMGVMSKYIDSAMSKTVNLPADYSYEDFKTLYMDAHDKGTIKGVTTYREGTMTSVLSSTESAADKEAIDKITKTNAPKRPKSLPCDIHNITVGGNAWTVLVGMFGNDPYEVFAFKKKNIQLSPKWKEGQLTKVKRGVYNLEIGEFAIENLSDIFETNEQEALTRLISLNLRHGVDINYIYEQLMKAEGTVVSFSKAIARTLKKYLNEDKMATNDCPECIKGKLVMTEGCYKCMDCGWSKC